VTEQRAIKTHPVLNKLKLSLNKMLHQHFWRAVSEQPLRTGTLQRLNNLAAIRNCMITARTPAPYTYKRKEYDAVS
jgi:hypothetical protein